MTDEIRKNLEEILKEDWVSKDDIRWLVNLIEEQQKELEELRSQLWDKNLGEDA